MKFSLTKFLMAVSSALDFIELDLLTTATNHGKRVALVCCRIGEALKLSKYDLFDLTAYALMHDSGIATYKFNNASNLDLDINILNTTENKNTYEHAKSHCITGENNVKLFPFFDKKPNVILYHHENYEGSGFFSVAGNDIPLFSQIIYISDYADLLRNSGMSKDEILDELHKMKGTRFLPVLVDIYEQLQAKPSFSMDLADMFIHTTLSENIPSFEIETNYEELVDLTEIFAQIIDSKSHFTARHSAGITEKTIIMADFYRFDSEYKAKATIAAHLHDLGKLAVPNTVLDKPGALSKPEFDLIQHHTYFTRKILSQIDDFEDITEWASNHHEKLNGKGYPYHLDKSRLDFCSRLMACIDIYQALTEIRPYRDGLSHNAAMNILKSCAKKSEIDSSIVDDIDNVFAN